MRTKSFQFKIFLFLLLFHFGLLGYSQSLSFNNMLQLRLEKLSMMQEFLIGENWKLISIIKKGPSDSYSYMKDNSDRSKMEFLNFDSYKSNKKISVFYSFLNQEYYQNLLIQCKTENFRLIKGIKNKNSESNIEYTFKGNGLIIEFYTRYVNAGKNKKVLTYNVSVMNEIFYSKYKNL